MKKNVLFVIPTMESGGVEVGFLEFARKNFEKKDINIFLLAAGGAMLSRIKHYDVQHIAFGVDTKNPFAIFRNIEKIKNVIRENRIDIVQVESRAPAWSCFYACRALDVPLITVVQFNGLFRRSLFPKKFYNSIMFRGNPVVAVSNFVRQFVQDNYRGYIRGKASGTIRVIPRGIDIGVYSQEAVPQNRKVVIQNEMKLPDDKIIITLPGRFAPQKGQEYFVDVLKYLKSDNYFCLLVGDTKKNPEYVERVRRRIYKHNLQGCVKIHDNINDMPALYVLSNIVVSASVQPESFGRTSIEAQAMGKIFLGTALGGTLETVSDGETGFLAPKNNARGFAVILDRVINLPADEKQLIAEKSKQNVIDNYSFEKMYCRMIDIYNRIDDYERFWHRH